MTKEIKRDYYLSKLIASRQNGLIKVITGIRRCGKSYLLNNLFYNYLIQNNVPKDHIIRFAFDSGVDLKMIGENLSDFNQYKRKTNPDKFMNYIDSLINDDEMYYLLLDEIQLLESFETVLNGYLYKKMWIYVTGSNAKFLSKDIISEFSGRGDEIHMFPLSFAEFMSTYDGDKQDALSQYMLYGGIPLVVLRENDQDKADMLKSLFTEIYISDITKRHNAKNKDALDDLLNILSSSIGSLTNPEKLKNSFFSIKKVKIGANTIRQYIDYMEDSFLINSVSKYDIKGKTYINAPKKYYFTDMGLRNARINFRQIEQTHIMENIIYNELIMRGFLVDVGVVTVIESNKNKNSIRKQLEVDFVCNQGFKRYYIQSAYSILDEEKKNREIRPFTKVNDSFKKILVTGDSVPLHYTDEGILVMNIYDFLLHKDYLDK